MSSGVRTGFSIFGPFAGGEVKRQSHDFERQKKVGEDDGGIDLEDLGSFDGDLGRDLRLLADLDQGILLADGAVLRHVASRLAHEPDRSPFGGLGLGGANKERIRGRHEPSNLAFSRPQRLRERRPAYRVPAIIAALNKIRRSRFMRPFAAIVLSFYADFPSLSFGADQGGANSAALVGYSPRASQSERDWETKFRAIPDPANLREYMRRLSARPHHVGSPYDKDNAEWILAHFKEWGLDAHIEQFDVLFPTPKIRVLEMVAPTKFTAKLDEPALAVDPTSNQKSEQLPTYNAYSIDGDVTAPLVFVNYGLPEDYEKLDRLGISVKGAIVIAQVLPVWRGMKPKVAAEHGAIGCLIYSEPQDDGYTRDNVFPRGRCARPTEYSAAA